MKAPVTITERDVHTLLGIVADKQQGRLPVVGLPWSVLSGLQDQIRCDFLYFVGRVPGPQAQPLLGKVTGETEFEFLLPRESADPGKLWLARDDGSEPGTTWLNQGLPDIPSAKLMITPPPSGQAGNVPPALTRTAPAICAA